MKKTPATTEPIAIEKSEYPITLDGKPFTLRYGQVALEAIENITDKPWMAVVAGALTGKISNLRVVLQAGLILRHPDLTVAKVIELIDASDYAEILESVCVAIAPLMARMKASAEKAKGRDIKKKITRLTTQMGA